MVDTPTIDEKIVDWKIVDKKTKISNVKKARPKILDGATYALKSELLKSTLYITINNIEEGDEKRPFEIFFNTRDSSKFVELQIITRLISAIFRRSESAVFVIDELKAVANPENTGYFRPPREGETKGRYIPSIFYEIGEVIEEHFMELGVDDPRLKKNKDMEPPVDIEGLYSMLNGDSDNNSSFGLAETGVECPQCHEKTLRRESGCDICTACGYSRCG